eukprot:TRINITY_DN4991_c0_g1_i1.p1 TRINITY_DN4991_c0_g1~~TRINITY_DN4991_c0_g1_i1.p1  ORF type:complete len:431 (+),score=83.57 TRINITY_DN4991_c0_g1_i1:45-1337(+)
MKEAIVRRVWDVSSKVLWEKILRESVLFTESHHAVQHTNVHIRPWDNLHQRAVQYSEAISFDPSLSEILETGEEPLTMCVQQRHKHITQNDQHVLHIDSTITHPLFMEVSSVQCTVFLFSLPSQKCSVTFRFQIEFNNSDISLKGKMEAYLLTHFVDKDVQMIEHLAHHTQISPSNTISSVIFSAPFMKDASKKHQANAENSLKSLDKSEEHTLFRRFSISTPDSSESIFSEGFGKGFLHPSSQQHSRSTSPQSSQSAVSLLLRRASIRSNKLQTHSLPTSPETTPRQHEQMEIMQLRNELERCIKEKNSLQSRLRDLEQKAEAGKDGQTTRSGTIESLSAEEVMGHLKVSMMQLVDEHEKIVRFEAQLADLNKENESLEKELSATRIESEEKHKRIVDLICRVGEIEIENTEFRACIRTITAAEQPSTW